MNIYKNINYDGVLKMAYEEIKDKNELLSRYSNDYSMLKALIDTLDSNIIDYIPEIPDAWSIKEHIAHLADTEVNGYIRCKKSILNPGTTLDLGTGDTEKSNKILDYASEDINDLMDLIRIIRKSIYNLVKKFQDEDFDKYFVNHVNHPIFTRSTLRFILSLHTMHFDKHLDYIKRNIELYKKK